MVWLLVDDSKQERESFADALSANSIVSVQALSASEVRDRLAEGQLNAEGLLMDIDLSNEAKRRESGLGLTADIRAAQYSGASPSFPIIRFSYRERVAQSIGRDSSSDDYFDLKVDKDNLNVNAVQESLLGISAVYGGIEQCDSAAKACGADEDEWSQWGHGGFDEELRVVDRDYLKARLITQTIVLPGLLISEELLAIRLGIDRSLSSGWPQLVAELAECRYSGIGSDHFRRWWARALEIWWESRATDAPLAATTISNRHQELCGEFSDLIPLTMPAMSPGDRPWRYCELTMEQSREYLPVDPSRAVRFLIHLHYPDWIDPTYAALGPAAKHAEDLRLDQSDLKRLSLFLRES